MVVGKTMPAVRMVLESVCILLSESTDWGSVQHVVGRMDFIERLKNYNKDDLPKSILRKLKNYLNKPEYDPEKISNVSQACVSLCNWCIAINQYSEAFEIVKPKKERVQQMQIKLEADLKKLKDKEEELSIQTVIGSSSTTAGGIDTIYRRVGRRNGTTASRARRSPGCCCL